MRAFLPDWVIGCLRPHWFPGKGRIFRALGPQTGERVASIFGFPMLLDLQDRIQGGIYLGTFEPRETALIHSYLQPGMRFLDVGANVGYFTALAASRVGPQGRVFAAEPSPYAHARLARWIGENRVSQVEALQTAFSSTPGTLRLYIPPEDRHNHTPSLIPSPEGTPVEVPVSTIDAWFAARGGGIVDLLKIDVEGYELAVLQGASEALKGRRIRAILCEFNDYWLRRAGTTPRDLFDFIVAKGFALRGPTPRLDAGCVENLFFVLST